MDATDFTTIQVLLKQSGFTVSAASTVRRAFGSWYVEIVANPSLRAAWDGKDGCLIVQEKTSEMFNGSYVWRDMWVEKTPSEQTPERAVQVLLAHVGAAYTGDRSDGS